MLQFACASLGITLVHTKPYDSAAKGKVERALLTVRKRFIPLLIEKDLSSFENLNERFSTGWKKITTVKSILPSVLHLSISTCPKSIRLKWSITLKLSRPSSLSELTER